ncbi:uncharacterized protein LOC112394958 [Neophocaena asiaeorientalis asiaeorientalis]|uniref:Uncharacterized protein LOC112394958 n=1 Tax=Neophocaena asiaeorientalis asiaeorientalis TaxID=1706337 RepID=A0A341AT86_NEOAA|nr:uncharacterized protein LOC112394958 [Neophocaena asiaeorientalis asiaeorientalis]
MCKNMLAAQVPPQPSSGLLPSWPARACGFWGGNQMIKGRNSMLLHLALHLPKPLVALFPLDVRIFSFSSSRRLGYLYLAHHLSCSTSHHALLCVAMARPPVPSRIPLITDHPDFLRRGALTPLHSAQKTSVEMSRSCRMNGHMSEHTFVWLAKMMYPWMEGQMEEQTPEPRPGGDWAGRALWALGKAPRRLEGNKKASGCQPNKWETACEAPHDASRSPLQPHAGGAAFSQLQRDHATDRPPGGGNLGQETSSQ